MRRGQAPPAFAADAFRRAAHLVSNFAVIRLGHRGVSNLTVSESLRVPGAGAKKLRLR